MVPGACAPVLIVVARLLALLRIHPDAVQVAVCNDQIRAGEGGLQHAQTAIDEFRARQIRMARVAEDGPEEIGSARLSETPSGCRHKNQRKREDDAPHGRITFLATFTASGDHGIDPGKKYARCPFRGRADGCP